MENEDKRPEVWVARRLMRRGCNCEPMLIAYFASKARVQAATRRFLKNGQEVKGCEIEYETPQSLEVLCDNNDVYAETGDWVKYNSNDVHKSYENALKQVKELNEKLVAKRIAALPSGYTDEIIEDAHKESALARELENCFDKTTYTNSRNNLKIF